MTLFARPDAGCRLARSLCLGTARSSFARRASSTPDRIFALANDVLAGNRAALARSITLAESTRTDHQYQATQLLSLLLAARKAQPERKSTFRVGISGPPGAGKSTFIEALGTMLVRSKNHLVAVLAVDPSSTLSGGSILGDKTRMNELSREPNAYVRPSPTRGTLGGVTRCTTEAIALCEAAGYDVILVETVGVGQSETAVDTMVDMFVLVSPPAAGDELQGIKKGIMELVDLVVINKADGPLLQIAKQSASEVRQALKLVPPRSDWWEPPVTTCSAAQQTGIEEVWSTIRQFWEVSEGRGKKDEKRWHQRRHAMWSSARESLVERFTEYYTGGLADKETLAQAEYRLDHEELTPSGAAHELVKKFLS
eukprot:TRINITY_DN15533_c0_g1_i1.p1 TRINITY_DN15533_c0_g1~~TRINITY_DN15533_c0_g1_i1.p1  ORF type:complete len:369 (-),score=80.63 TRINITY_DN15533_c0_g1_i1:139-1245(-)